MTSNLKRIAKAAMRVALLAVSAIGLASCGGGNQVQTFVAGRVIAFGDEMSVINTDGSKYTVNALATGSTTQLECAGNPLWIQSVAAIYGLVFPQCPGGVAAPPSRIYAANNARVADLAAQIDAQVGNGGFAATDLVTVLVGANDVVAQFQQFPAVGEAQLADNLTAAGAALAAQVNRIAGYGAKVLIVTIPDMGLTPFGGDRSVGSTDGNPGLLSRLSTKFNDSLLAKILNDGHKIGLVQLDEYLKAVDTNTRNAVGTYANTTLALCIAALPGCTTNTLRADAANGVWLWADSRHLTPSGQAGLASLAATRAQNNPF